MQPLIAFNLWPWIEAYRRDFEPPVGNQVIWEGSPFTAMIIREPQSWGWRSAPTRHNSDTAGAGPARHDVRRPGDALAHGPDGPGPSAMPPGGDDTLLEVGLGRLTRMAPSGVLVFDRQGRLVQTDARAGERLLDMGLTLDLKPDLRIDAFSLEDTPQAGEAKAAGMAASRVDRAGHRGGNRARDPRRASRGAAARQRTPHAPATARASDGALGGLGHIIGHGAPFYGANRPGATLKVYPAAPHGLCSTLKDQVNADLLAFLKA